MQASENTLPLPPSDEQKFSYVKRRVWLLNLFAVSSFAAVAYSTILFSALDDALWPFVALLGASIVPIAYSWWASRTVSS